MKLRSRLAGAVWNRPVAVVMAFVACLVLGIVAWQRIPLQLMPSGFEPRFLWVWMPYRNASPVEVDEAILRPVEDQLRTVSGIDTISARASSGSATFSIEFHNSVSLDEAYNAVVDRIERALPELPDDVERYGVFRYNPDDEPIVWAGVSLPEDLEDPHYVMTQVVQPKLERIRGVAALDVWGVPERGVWIDYDKARITSHGVNLGALQRRMAADNFQLPSGSIHERGWRWHVRGLSPIEDVDELATFPVRDDVVLADIADVRVRSAYSTSIHRVDGLEAAAIGIRKESSANAVEVSREIENVLTELESDPRVEGARFHIFFSQGRLIEDGIDTLLQAASTGGVFAVGILWLFLREWRMTLLLSASIPFSIVMTVGALYAMGDSLNLLTLMGLMLAVGMVVDNAIVVVEAIWRRRANGEGVRDAAVRGAGEVNLAIVLSTLTTMVVFLPVILMSEDPSFSFFMGAIARPVIYALLASLMVALAFAPLATRFVRHVVVQDLPRWQLWMSDAYGAALRVLLRRRRDSWMSIAALALFTATVALPGVQCTDSTDGNLNSFGVRFTVPPQADPYERHLIVKAFEEAVDTHRDAWGVRVFRSRLRSHSRQGEVWVYLKDDGPIERADVIEAAREAMPAELPGVTWSIGRDDGQGDGAKQLTLWVRGEDMNTLFGLADEVARRVREVDDVLGVHVDVENEGADEVRLRVDRQAAARYGVSAQSVGQMVSYAMRGANLPKLRDGDKEIHVTSRFALKDRSDLATLMDLEVWSPVEQGLVPIRALADAEVGKGPAQISRRDGHTSTSVTVDLMDDANKESVARGIDGSLADFVLPQGYTWSRGDDEQRREAEDEAMVFALLLSVVFVYLIMGVLFESWLVPLAIVPSVPLAMMGASWLLMLTDTDFDAMAGVGMVILVGIIVNNGIVLIDLVTQLRATGVERTEALIEAGKRRLRPILLTAATTVCGLLPMALGSSTFVGIPYAPLGRTVIGGLVAGTVLTLLFVPFLYSVLDDIKNGANVWWSRFRRA